MWEDIQRKISFVTRVVRFMHLCRLFFHSNVGSVLRLPLLKMWCPPPSEMTEKPPKLIILTSRARLAGPRLWVCVLDTRPRRAQPHRCTTIRHAWTSLEKGWRQGHRESCCDLCQVPRDDHTGMQPAGRERVHTIKRYFQEKQGEEELLVLDASKVEDTLGKHYF